MSKESYVIAMDLGGTKVTTALVNSEGQIHRQITGAVHAQDGPDSLIRQMTNMVLELKSCEPQTQRLGIASAGPLDPVQGTLLDPTNLTTNNTGWGVVPLKAPLSQSTGLQVWVENDAAAAVLAEHWLGALRDTANGLMVTLGTGVGVGAICNGRLLRAGQHLHPEAGHLSLNAWDKTAPCGCGNWGCIEAYLSGKNFTQRLARQWKRPDLRGEDIVEMARSGEPLALTAFSDYAEAFAQAVKSWVVLFCPEVIVISGGFSASCDLFLDQAHSRLQELMVRRRAGKDLYPKIVVSHFGAQAPLIGAARVAFHPDGLTDQNHT